MDPTKLGLVERGGFVYSAPTEKKDSPEQPIAESSSSLDIKNKRQLEEEQKKLEVEESLKKPGEKEASPEKKKRKTEESNPVSSSKQSNEPSNLDPGTVYTQLRKCLGSNAEKHIKQIEKKIARGKIKTQQELVSSVFNIVIQRFVEKISVSTQEILKLHMLLFEGPLQPFSEKEATKTQNPVSPHCSYIVQSLYNCINAISKFGTSTAAVDAAEMHINNEPKPENHPLSIQTIIAQPTIIKKLEKDVEAQGLVKIYKEYVTNKENWEKKLKEFPLVPTKVLFRSENMHETYALGDGGKCHWIFKPVQKKMGEYCGNDPQMTVREYAASQLNYKKQFPIPKTILVEIQGWVGSAQFFIEEAKKLSKIIPSAVSRRELQALAIFDLLFGNMDRHVDNILCKEVSHVVPPIFIPYGIDHDDCLRGLAKGELKLEYQSLEAIHKPFDATLEEIVSSEYLKNYEEIKRYSQMNEDAISWMYTAAGILKNAISKGRTVKKAIDKISKKWDGQFSGLDF